MLAIKLQRIGKKGQPSYRLVVAERRSKMAAPPVEDLGSYNPFTKLVQLNQERAAYWLKVGAQPTVTAHNILVKSGTLKALKRKIKMKKVVVAQPLAVEAAPAVKAAPTT